MQRNPESRSREWVEVKLQLRRFNARSSDVLRARAYGNPAARAVRRFTHWRLVRRHAQLASLFMVHKAATRHAALSTTIGDVVTRLDRLRRSNPATGTATVALPGVERDRYVASGSLRILVVDRQLPAHDRASGSVRLFHILRLLREAGHHVTFLSRKAEQQERYRADLEAIGIVVHAGDPERLRRRGRATEGPDLDLAAVLRHGRFDIAWLDFFEVAEQYMPEIRAHAPSTRILVDTVDVHWIREQRQAEVEQDPRRHRQARVTRLREERIYRSADGLIAVTDDDASGLRQLAPNAPMYVFGNVHPLDDAVRGFESRSGVLFIGNFDHSPNVDAALYLVRKVMPLVWATCPAVDVTIVGPNPRSVIRQLADSRVMVTGHVPHTRPYLDAARVSVAPLRFGAGMKGKVGEALAAGLPVVTTSIGAEGMGLENGVHALISDTAAGLAASIKRLHEEPDLWRGLSQSGREEVDRRYGIDVARCRLTDLLRRVASRTAYVWAPDWADDDRIDEVLGFYAETFLPEDSVALVVGYEASVRGSSRKAAAGLAASLARLGRDPGSIANVTLAPFWAGRGEALLCPGAVWIPTARTSSKLGGNPFLEDLSGCSVTSPSLQSK